MLGGLVILMMLWLVSLPFAAWRHTVLRDYGLSTQNWGGWAVDLLKGCAVGGGDRRGGARPGSTR